MNISHIQSLTQAIYSSVSSNNNDNKKYVFLSNTGITTVETKTTRSSMREIANLVSKLNQEAQGQLNDSHIQRSIMDLESKFKLLEKQYKCQTHDRYSKAHWINKIFYAIFSLPTYYACQYAFTTLKQTRNLLMQNFSSQIDIEDTKTHGSLGFKQASGVAIAHESYGGENDKRDKEGRNCDRAGIGFNISGRPCAIVADGSGVKKCALVVASGSVQGALAVLSKKEYFSTDVPKNSDSCKELLLDTLDPCQNPFWASQKLGNNGDNPENWGGSTTASIASTFAHNGQLYIGGAVLGDAIALHIDSKGNVSILACDVGDPEKEVSNAKGQLISPTLGYAGGLSKGAQVVAFAKEVTQGDRILLSSDFLSDNIANTTKELFQQTISYIIQHSVFDDYNSLTPLLQILTIDPELLFHEDQQQRAQALERLKKPTNIDFEATLGARDVDLDLTEEKIVRRLNNYSKWINQCLTLPVMTRIRKLLDQEFLLSKYSDLMTIEPKLPLQQLIDDRRFNIHARWENLIDHDKLSEGQRSALKLFFQDYSTCKDLMKIAEQGLFGKSDDATVLVFDPFIEK